MSFRTLFHRADGTGYAAVYFGRDAEALAVGNGFDSFNPLDPDYANDTWARNTIAHAATSAYIAYDTTTQWARIVGNWKESTPFTYETADEWADQYNNEVGRRIADYAKANGLSKSDIDDLIMDAYQNGDLITDHTLGNPAINLGVDPRTAPGWIAPQPGWQGSSLGKDYSAVDEFVEDPIGYALRLGKLTYIGAQVIGGAMQQALLKFGAGLINGSPLVFDLDDSGTIELNSIASSTAFWDIDQDGFAEKTGWVTGGDGLLALDFNDNGIIDDNGELFGTVNQNGFAILAQHDSNSDGVINAQDAVWTNLIMWRDNNEDGYSQDAELHNLAYFNITEISLSASNVSLTNQGHAITHTSTFTVNDGINPPDTRIVHDVWFQFDNANTRYNDDIEVDPMAMYLPFVRGYGNLADMPIAATLDSDLKDLLTDFASQSFTDIFSNYQTTYDDIKDILFQWADVAGVNSTSRGSNIDARELEFLEVMVGQEYLQRGYYSNPFYWAAEDLKEAFHIAYDTFAARILIDTLAGKLFEGGWTYNISTDTYSGVTGLDASYMSQLSSLATSAADKVAFWQNIVRMIEFTVGVSSLSGGDQDALEDAINGSNPSLHLTDILNSLEYASETGVTLSGTSSANTLTGGVGNDVIAGGYGNDTLNGGIGADKLYGEGDNDTLNGGTGADFVQGGFGNDTYRYNLGDGTDTIIEEGSGTGNDADKIRFGSGISSGHITLTRVGNWDLVIDINTGTQTGRIVIEDQFNHNASVETLDYNGTSTASLVNRAWTMYGTSGADTLYGVLSGGLLTDTIYGQGGNDTIYSDTGNDIVYGGDGDDYIEGGDGVDTLYGDAGNDTIYGSSGNDVIHGGAGDDTLDGGGGSDNYHYISGKDTIVETSGTDKIILNSVWNGVTPEYLRIGSDLRLQFDLNNYITIQDHFASYVETLQYANGMTVNLTTVSYVAQGTSGDDSLSGNASANTMFGEAGNDSLYGGDGNDTMYGGDGDDMLSGENHNDTMYGGAGNDTIYGGSGNNYFDGGAGDDYLEGGSGNDTYFYASGYDKIYDYGGTDSIKIVEGYDSGDITFARRISGTSDLYDLRVEFSSTNYIVIDDYFSSSSQRIESLVLFDLTSFTLSSLAYTSYGSSSDDSLWGVTSGGSTNDIMYGLSGNDTLDGDTGNDTLYGGSGNDTLYGGAGNDIYVFESGLDIFDEYGSGTDTLRIGGSFTIDNLTFSSVGSYDTKITINSGTNEITVKNLRYSDTAYHIENIEFSDGFKTTLPNYASWINGTSSANTLTGTGAAETIVGKGGNDTINGSGGNDNIHGGSGNDTIRGGTGSDLVHGGTGNDNIYGQDGLDTLYGGTGSDKFIFEAASAYNHIDVIKDFKLSENDKIDLASLLASYNPLTHAIEDFVQITDSGANSVLRVDRDGTASTYTWKQIATLEGVTGLTNEATLKASGNLITA